MLFVFTFLEVLHCCLRICSGSQLLPSLLTDFGREIPVISTVRDSEAFQIFYGYAYSMLLIPSCDGILELVCLLLILPPSEPGADSLSFAFLRAESKLKFVVSLSGLQTWAGFLSVLTSHLPKLTLSCCHWEYTNSARHRVGVWGGRCTECWGCLWVIWGDRPVRNYQWFVGRLLDRVFNAVSRICVPFFFFNIITKSSLFQDCKID